MSFAVTGLLTILLHLAPNLVGASWSVYKHHGITIDHSHAKPVKPRR